MEIFPKSKDNSWFNIFSMLIVSIILFAIGVYAIKTGVFYLGSGSDYYLLGISKTDSPDSFILFVVLDIMIATYILINYLKNLYLKIKEKTQ